MASTMRFDMWEDPTSTVSVSIDQLSGGSGLVPIIPTSAVVGSGSASVSATGVVTVTGASYLSLNDVFTSAYPYYRIIANHTGSVSGNFYFRYISSGSTVSAGYYYVGQYVNISGTIASWSGSNVTQIETGKIHTSAGLSGFIMDVTNPAINIVTRCLWNSHGDNGSSIFTVNGGAHVYTPLLMQGIYLYPGAGTFSGTFQIYGYR